MQVYKIRMLAEHALIWINKYGEVTRQFEKHFIRAVVVHSKIVKKLRRR
jgi:hypothetical protein